ncbi:cysteine dioxygenase [Rhizocola hellebori]|uniref:cysteine dioxygenase n=1 Tax=Rhizocola hellebori TaxID=1392758 RepID=UPI0019417682|nr:cysteine dioxygenase family protein [Rhizocola hellebori]
MTGTVTVGRTAQRTSLLDVARRFAAAPDDWAVAPRFNPRERWYYRLSQEPDYEVWLLTWLPGQHTDLHDHGGSAGAFVVVSGVLTEQTVSGEARAAVVEQTLRAGQGRGFGSNHVHRILNHGRVPAVSVHVYGPALQSMTRYHISENRLKVSSVDRAGVQW